VLGNRQGPEPKVDFLNGKGLVQGVILTDPAQPIQNIKVLYASLRTRDKDLFWKPADHIHVLLGSPIWLAPWLIVYLLAYIPAMFLTKWLLRVP